MNTKRLLTVAAVLVQVGCGGSDSSTDNTSNTSPYPYTPGQTSVVGAGAAPGSGAKPTEATTPTGAGCLKDDKGKCVDLAASCPADSKVDVVVNKDGVVVDVICYPTGQVPVSSPEKDPPGDRTYSNGQVVVLDGTDDGDDIKGNVDVDSNNVTIWGEGPDVSVIGGNLDITKNDGVVRGVRIKGNVTITGNNVTLLLCVVEGDVTINGNNNVLASCDVYGKVIVAGQNDAVVNNRIQGALTDNGSGLTCDNNISFTDKDSDKLFDEGEAGAAISCGGGKGK